MAVTGSMGGLGSIVSWGISPNARQNITSAVNGIVTSWSSSLNYEKADCRNEVGSKIGEVVYDYGFSARATVQVATSVKVPPPTTVVTVGTVQYVVTGGEVAEENQNFRKINLTLEASGYRFTPQVADNSFNNA